MFDFLFKRRASAAEKLKLQQAQVAAQQSAHKASVQENKQQQIEQKRAETLASIARAASDEEALISLLASCDFADGRLQAAQQIHTPQGIKKALVLVRNSDKRVAKLLQARLDSLAQVAQQQKFALALLEQARQIAQASPLTANQLVELDKQREKISFFPEDVGAQFTQLRETIAERLLTQAALQRQVLILIARLSAFAQNLKIGRAELDQVQQEFDQIVQQPDADGVPKSLRAEFARKFALATDALRYANEERLSAVTTQKVAPDSDTAINDHAAIIADAAVESSVNTSENDYDANSDATQNVVTASDSVDAEKTNTVKRPIDKRKAGTAPILSVEQILTAIEGMEQALEQGSVIAAQTIDRELRGLDPKKSALNVQQKERLLKVRNELSHLQGWAKWGGSISREELIKAAEELPQQELPVTELAKKISGLRERWKSLEAPTGVASKDVWERFDSACTLAYAPAAAHFLQLAEERKANLEKANALIDALRIEAEKLLADEPRDWKAISLATQQARQAWQKLGYVERKHKPLIDAEFDAVYVTLAQPLVQRQQQAINEREALIQQVQSISADQRNGVEQLRAIQARWQEQAQALPLRRRDDQALWERFRAASDALFAQRRAASEQLEGQRKDNLAAKQALCEKLEQSASHVGTASTGSLQGGVTNLIQEAAAGWRDIGYVDREDEAAIEQRYQAAITLMKQAAQQLREQQLQKTNAATQKKLALIQQAEALLMPDVALDAGGESGVAVEAETDVAVEISVEVANVTVTKAEQVAQLVGVLKTQWSKAGEHKSPLEAALKIRFERAVQAASDGDVAYGTLLQSNAASVDEKLLQLEVLIGIDSPPEFVQRRLQAKVEALRASLKTGGTQGASEQLRALLVLPASLNSQQVSRLDKLLEHHS